LIEVNCELTLKLLESYEQGGYDIIVFKQEPAHNLERAISLWEEPLVWVHGKGYDLNKAIEEKLLRLVLSPSPCVYRKRAIDALESEGIGWEQVYTSQSVAGTIAAVRGNLGVTALPVTSVPTDLLHVPHAYSSLPVLKSTEIKLLSVPSPSQAILAFQNFIQESLTHTELDYYKD
jgi:DNA-binding transcriptional LysR family regulator